MKNTFRKILAVGMTLALVSSFFAAVPVSAEPGCNAWGEIDTPDFKPYTEVGVMNIASDGTMFLAVYYEEEYDGDKAQTWDIMYSEDGGFKWKATNLTGISDLNPFDLSEGATPVKIETSPMWPDNKNVYVALSDGVIWRLPNAGKGTPAMIKGIVDKQTQVLGHATETYLYDMDIWADGTYNYLAVATDLDVFVIKDQLLQEWVDYELNVDIADSYSKFAREVRFAPDFAISELIWAVVADDDRAPGGDDWAEGNLYITSADSPARWGHVFEEIAFTNYNATFELDTMFVDMEFDPDYSAANPQLYVAIASDLYDDDVTGNLYQVYGEASQTGPGPMESGYIFFEDQALGTVEVSGNTIMVQNSWTGDVYTTNDAGNTWPIAKRSPSGNYWGQLFMHPEYSVNKTVFSTVMDGRWAGVDGGISGVYRSIDGGVFFDGISWLDMPIDYAIKDLAFDPKGGSQPALMIIDSDPEDNNGGNTDYIFYTADATAESVQWLMKDSMLNFEPAPAVDGALEAINMISWDIEGDVVMFIGERNGEYYVYRSYDDGNSFGYWRKAPVLTVGAPVDWVVVDNNTISVVGENGYWGTRGIGTEVKTAFAATGVSIDRFGNNIAMGFNDGTDSVILLSADAGLTWGAPVTIADGGNAYVAYNHQTGALYAATEAGAVYSVGAKVTKLADDAGDFAEAAFSGIWVSPDNPTVYAMGEAGELAEGLVVPDGTIITLSSAAGTVVVDVDYTVGDIDIWVSDITVLGGSIKSGDEVYFYSANVKAQSSSTAIGTIWVAKDVEGSPDPNEGLGEFEIVINDATSPFDMFGDWPADLSVAFEPDPFTVGAADEDEGGSTMFRLLISDDPDNVWENKPQPGAVGLWGTTTSNNSNILWTVVGTNSIYALEDHNTVPVAGVSVQEVEKDASSATKKLQVSWTALDCTTCYEIYINGEYYDRVASTTAALAGSTLTEIFGPFDFAKKYDVQVRACAGGPLQSRLSAKASVTTECYIVAPTPLVPAQGMQDASIAPSFVWAAPTAGCNPTKYEFQLATDEGFNNIIVSETALTYTGYTYEARDLDYDTDHYWRVRSVAGDGVKSAWTNVQNFHTMLEPQPPVTIPPQPTPTISVTVSVPPANTITIPPAQTVTVPPAVIFTQTVTQAPDITLTVPEQETPVYIWVIVAIGALLVIAVIVLIIRTRRAE